MIRNYYTRTKYITRNYTIPHHINQRKFKTSGEKKLGKERQRNITQNSTVPKRVHTRENITQNYRIPERVPQAKEYNHKKTQYHSAIIKDDFNQAKKKN